MEVIDSYDQLQHSGMNSATYSNSFQKYEIQTLTSMISNNVRSTAREV